MSGAIADRALPGALLPPAQLAVADPAAFRDLLAATMADCGVTVDGPFVPTRPFLLPGPVYDDLHRAGRRVIDLLHEAVERSGSGISDRIQALGADPADYPLFGDAQLEAETAALMARPDAVLGADGPKFLEFNVSGTFGGTTESHLFRDLWSDLFDVDGATLWAHDSFAARRASLHDLATAWGLPPAVAVVGSQRDVPGATTARYFDLEVEYLRAHGWDAVFTEPEDLLTTLGPSAAPRYPLGLRYFNTRDWTDAGIDPGPVRTALARGWRLAPAQSAGLLANKRVLAWVSSVPPWMTGADADLVHRWLPWTRELRTAESMWQGERHRLPDLLLRHREYFVVKRCIGMMGREVTIGRDTAPAQWARVVRRALAADDCVVQEYIEPLSLPVTLLGRDGALHDLDVRPVLSPCIYGEHPGGCWARFFPTGEAGVVSVYGFGALENVVMALDPDTRS